MATIEAGSAHMPLLQGELQVTGNPDARVTTILGSCVATLIWDDEAHVGGLNHLLLPHHVGARSVGLSHDVNLMELLINGILQAGGSKDRFKAKVFGGAHVVEGLGETGVTNARFVGRFLKDEGIPCIAQSLGGAHARKLQVWPALGRVRQKILCEATGLSLSTQAANLGAMSDALGMSGVELL